MGSFSTKNTIREWSRFQTYSISQYIPFRSIRTFYFHNLPRLTWKKNASSFCHGKVFDPLACNEVNIVAAIFFGQSFYIYKTIHYTFCCLFDANDSCYIYVNVNIEIYCRKVGYEGVLIHLKVGYLKIK